MANFSGTTGNDVLTGTSHNDYFDINQGGRDSVSGLDGEDIFYLGSNLNPYSRFDGGTGQDTVELKGDYANLVLRGQTFTSIEHLQLDGGHDYRIKENNGNVAAGRIMSVDASRLGSGNWLHFNGTAETDGRFAFTGGAGDDILRGGSGDDIFYLTSGGNDRAVGGGGRDIFIFGGALNSEDRINGGVIADHVVLDGNYAGDHELQLLKNHMNDVQIFAVRTGHDYDITAADGAFGTKDNVLVNIVAYTFVPGDHLTFDGHAETHVDYRFLVNDGTLDLTGGARNDSFLFGGKFNSTDILHGGAGDDVLVLNGEFQHPERDGDFTGANAVVFGADQLGSIETLALIGGYNYDIATADGNVRQGHTLTIDTTGFVTHGDGSGDGNMPGLGASDTLTFDGSSETDGRFVFEIGGGTETLTGGARKDTFDFASTPLVNSTRVTIEKFDFSNDVIKFANVATIDGTVTHGDASSGTLDQDLTDLFGNGQSHELSAGHAVLFTPDGGDLAGNTFLIVAGNGTTGYVAGQDLVVELSTPMHQAQVSASNFAA